MNNIPTIIAKEHADDFPGWKAPKVDGPIINKSSANTSKSESSMPTAEQIQALQKDAYDEAYKKGFDIGQKEGRDKAYKENHEAGHKEGYAKGYEETQEYAKSFHALLNSLDEPLKKLDEHVEITMQEMITLITRQLLKRELRTEPAEIVVVIREALKALPRSASLPTIKMHPEDVTMVRKTILADDYENQTNWRFEDDTSLEKGDCIIETDSSLINATIEERLTNIISTLFNNNLEGEKNSVAD